jgi:uncharacterized phage protein (TIGR02218 family)
VKTIATVFQEHLDTGTTTLAWCWRITRKDGEVFGFTDFDQPLTFEGTTFEPETALTASDMRTTADMAVDSQDAEGAISSESITETDIQDGLWDNALVESWRVNWQDTSQRLLMRKGALGQVRRGKTVFVAEVRSLAHVLSQTLGRSFQPYCDAKLGDSRCKVNLSASAFNASGSVAAVQRDRAFLTGALGSFDEEFFAFGTITWTSGANSGRTAEVESSRTDSGQTRVTLLEVPILPIQAGDLFAIRAGCDKTAATCKSKFSNFVNFRGFPHIPGNDAIFRYAVNGQGGSGDPL